MLTVQELIATLDRFWQAHGCVLALGHDVETGAGTFNPNTFFKCLGPEPYRAAYVEISRRPADGRYGENPNRMQLFHQYQVAIKPSPPNIQELYLSSLEAIGFHLPDHDIRFVHDDWEQPSLGASGLGWEVWRDGMEVTQFTYFQQVAGYELEPVMVELTLGIERLAMTLQGVDTVWDLKWSEHLSYRDIYQKGEIEWCTYNFEQADVETLRRHYQDYSKEAERLAQTGLPHPAYDFVMKASHAFNVLEARGVISVPERTSTIAQVRKLAKLAAESYVEERRKLQFPLMDRWIEKREKAAPDNLSFGFKSLIFREIVLLARRFWMKLIAYALWARRKAPRMEGKIAEGQGLKPKAQVNKPTETHTLLLEIGSEELPAAYIPGAMASLKNRLEKLLKDVELPSSKVEVFGAPRRLTALIHDLPLGKAEQKVEKRGPPVSAAFDNAGNLTQAGEGFFRSVGLEPQKQDQAEVRGDYLYAAAVQPAEKTAEILSKHLPELILGIDFPKKMRWGSSKMAYARPLHWICALHGKWVIPFKLGQLHSGRTTYGHRQRAPAPLSLKSADDYLKAMRAAKVMIDPAERKNTILEQLSVLEKKVEGEALALPKILPHVVHLTEWPELALGSFEAKFLKIPQEILVSEMVEHQKLFPLAKTDGKLLNRFVITADNTPNEKIRKGNERVLTARLADGEFLYHQDLKIPLDTFNEKLKAITFHKGLGSLHDKAQRLVQYTKVLHDSLKIGSLAEAEMAALYSKADLASGLVGEFPELQGTIGHAYALVHGLAQPVAMAIDEHWMPRGDKGALPATPAGILLSLADKIDNLISCFALGLIPSSSSDPYALRRQVLAIVRIAIHHKQPFPLFEVLETCYHRFTEATGKKADPKVIPAILDFFNNRIRTVFQDYGFSKPQIESALSKGVADVYDSYLRVEALHKAHKEDPAFPLLAEVFKRSRGILLEKGGIFDLSKAVEPAERELAKVLETVESATLQAIQERDYPKAYQLIAQLQPPLHILFDEVKVMCEDKALRENRLALIGQVFALFDKLLDFSKLHLA